MSLNFVNEHNVTAYGAIIVLDQSCGSTPWRKLGWYAVPPGGSTLVMTGNQHDLPFTNFAWFACTFADGPCWSGNLWYRVMHNNSFNQCFVDDTGCNALWPFQADQYGGGWSSLDISLKTPGAPNREWQGDWTIVRTP
jgi:hypothetical protein